MSFDYLSHTADLQAVVGGDDLEELYSEAVRLVRDVLVGDSEVRSVDTRRLELDADDEAERFFRFVRELLFLYDSEAFVPARLEPRRRATIAVRGERFDPGRHHSERQVKALTRHGFTFEREADGYRAVLLFDL